MKRLLALCVLLLAVDTGAEQMQRLGDWDVHYILFPTTFLNPEIAASYGITRGADLALLNISVLNDEGTPTRVSIEGTVTNLLGQQQPLGFSETREEDAVYYLASIRYTDREVLRFAIDITPPDGKSQRLEFQQQMYIEPQ
jgi:hypothetical protein